MWPGRASVRGGEGRERASDGGGSGERVARSRQGTTAIEGAVLGTRRRRDAPARDASSPVSIPAPEIRGRRPSDPRTGWTANHTHAQATSRRRFRGPARYGRHCESRCRGRLRCLAERAGVSRGRRQRPQISSLSLSLMSEYVKVFDACMTSLSTRADGRRSKSANGRNRGRVGTRVRRALRWFDGGVGADEDGWNVAR
jgi:hypothetical protein